MMFLFFSVSSHTARRAEASSVPRNTASEAAGPVSSTTHRRYSSTIELGERIRDETT